MGVTAIAGPMIGPVDPPEFHVMSWNIRRKIPAPMTRRRDRWELRVPGVRALLAAERPTVLCVQEAVADQIADLSTGLGPRYHHVGRGRSGGGTGEACPIFYDRARVDLVKWEQSALSDEPDRAGSRGWGNPFPRVVVAAVLRDRRTSEEFLVANTHLDPLSARSRLRSVRAVRELVSTRALPAVVAGDFNAGSRSATMRELLSGGLLVDTWEVASSRVSEPWGTYGGYREPRSGGRRLDRILTTPAVSVSRAAINPLRHRGGWPSDHLPVQAVLCPYPAGGEGARGT